MAARALTHVDVDALQRSGLCDLPVDSDLPRRRGLGVGLGVFGGVADVDDEVTDLAKEVALVDVPRFAVAALYVLVGTENAQPPQSSWQQLVGACWWGRQ
jgi:hypothetical protein